MTNEILERIAALEADVSQLKQNSMTRQDIGQLISLVSDIRSQMTGIRSEVTEIKGDTSRIRGEVSQLGNRVQRLEEHASVLPKLATKIEAIGNDIKRLAQEMYAVYARGAGYCAVLDMARETLEG
jgi:chromosome segregation ATPase